MDVKIRPGDLQAEIEKALREYGDIVYRATEEGLEAAQNVLIEELKAASPKRTGKFAKAWKGTGKKYKLMRFVGNSVTVKSGKKEVPLSNILEYSPTRGKPFIKRTFDASVEKMAAAAVAAIKKEV